MKKLTKTLSILIERAKFFGLPDKDVNEAKECLDYGEFECSLEVIAAQLYEYKIEIDKEFYDMVLQIAGLMELPIQKYHYLEKLIRSNTLFK